MLAAFFQAGNARLRAYFAIIGEVVGDASGAFILPELVEVLADVGGGLVLLTSGERAAALTQGGAKSGRFTDDAQYLVPKILALGACR